MSAAERIIVSGIACAVGVCLGVVASSNKSQKSSNPGSPTTREAGARAAKPVDLTSQEQLTDKHFTDALTAERGFARNQLLERVAYIAALDNMSGALARLDQVVDLADRAFIIRGIFAAAARLNTVDATGWLKALKGSDAERDEAFRVLITSWRGGSPPEERGVLVGTQQRLGLWGEMALSLIPKDVDRSIVVAQELLMNGVGPAVLAHAAIALDPRIRDSRVRSLYEKLAEPQRRVFVESFAAELAASPFRGWEFAVQLPESEWRTAALVAQCTEWGAKLDDAARKKMFDQLPEGLGRIEAVEALSRAWSRSNPASARAWIASLWGKDRSAAERGLGQ
jgi:hypothetical protein